MSEVKTSLSESAANLSAYESYHGLTAEAIQRSFLDHLEFTLAKDRFTVTHLDQYLALAYAVRDRLIERWLRTQDTYYRADAKRVYYLSMEFLMGRTLGNAIVNLNLKEECRRALLDLGYRLEDIQETEPDAGLGNGGLGGWQPASWIPWRHLPSPATVMVSATSTASSTKESRMANRSNSRTTGSGMETHGRLHDRKCSIPSTTTGR